MLGYQHSNMNFSLGLSLPPQFELVTKQIKPNDSITLVFQGEDLANQGFGGIYGVGKAAIHAPALVVLSHTPKGAVETVAWVGKGIVYDTGGLSIKVSRFFSIFHHFKIMCIFL